MTITAGQTLGHWIDGRPDDTPGPRAGEVTESATGDVVVSVPFADGALVDRAVGAATRAASQWGRASLGQRTKVMFAFRQLLDGHREELASLVVREHGKVHADALGEVQRGLEIVDFACGLGHLLKGEMSADVSSGVDSYSLRQPLGVVAGITPFNFPVMVPLWMAPIALACGAVRGRDQGVGRQVEVGVGQHHRVVLGPAQRLHALPVRGPGGVDVAGHRGRADEGDRSDPRVLEESVDGRLVAVDDAEGAVRQARPAQQLGDQQRR